jgi:hypothetical protein
VAVVSGLIGTELDATVHGEPNVVRLVGVPLVAGLTLVGGLR